MAEMAWEVGEIAGLPPVVPLAQVLLAGAGVAASQLMWHRDGEEVPRTGRPSVTFVGGEEDLPFWFRYQLSPLLAWHEKSKQMAAEVSASRPRRRKPRDDEKLEELLQEWSPELVPDGSTESVRTETDVDLLIDVGSRIGRVAVKPNEFGRDRLVILNGDPAYRALGRASGHGPLLKSASVNVGPGLRTTLHGWVSAKTFRRMVRERDPEEARSYGWLVPADRLPTREANRQPCPPMMLAIFQNHLGLRYGEWTGCFTADYVTEDLLNRVDHKWRAPRWCSAEPLVSLLRGDENLAWQLAASMAVMSHGVQRKAAEDSQLWSLAASVAQWIRAVHCREVRLLFPGPPHNPADKLSCKIADKLRLAPHSTRDLVRCCHKEKTEVVRATLHRMRDEGWVAETHEDRWRIDFPRLPEVSANLSKIAAWPLFREPSQLGFLS